MIISNVYYNALIFGVTMLTFGESTSTRTKYFTDKPQSSSGDSQYDVEARFALEKMAQEFYFGARDNSSDEWQRVTGRFINKERLDIAEESNLMPIVMWQEEADENTKMDEEESNMAEDKPKIAEEKNKMVEDKPKMNDEPSMAERNPKIAEDKSKTAKEKTKIAEEKPKTDKGASLKSPAMWQEEAMRFLAEEEPKMAEEANLKALAAWNYAARMTKKNKAKMDAANARSSTYERVQHERVNVFPRSIMSDPDLRRKLKKMSSLGISALPDEQLLRFNDILVEMQDIYVSGKGCSYTEPTQCNQTLADLDGFLASSQNPEELKHAWLEWHRVSGQRMRSLYAEYVELSNMAARLNSHIISIRMMEIKQDARSGIIVASKLVTRYSAKRSDDATTQRSVSNCEDIGQCTRTARVIVTVISVQSDWRMK
uniref:Uncharacterized protein n=1 Tax=Timema shepardi TaxID=629360 RepID=A0A7R9AS99_TIMSH|nr:unnamed protein product [Timema shepardi]